MLENASYIENFSLMASDIVRLTNCGWVHLLVSLSWLQRTTSAKTFPLHSCWYVMFGWWCVSPSIHIGNQSPLMAWEEDLARLHTLQLNFRAIYPHFPSYHALFNYGKILWTNFSLGNLAKLQTYAGKL